MSSDDEDSDGQGPPTSGGCKEDAAPPVRGQADCPGIFDYDSATSAQSICIVCGQRIARGMWRFKCLTRRGTKMSYRRYLHFHCAIKLPCELLPRSQRAILHFLHAGDLPAQEYEALEHVYEGLMGPSTAASSGGAS